MYRWVEHTAELELEIAASTQEDVFAEAVAAFAELLGGDEDQGPARHEISVRNPDPAARLADWLEELVYLGETEGFVPRRLLELVLAGDEARGVVEGRRGSPPHLVKAVTYHGLELRRDNDGWAARVVLDV